MSRAATAVRALALAAASAAVTACSSGDPTLDLAHAHEVSLTVTLRETVSWRGRKPAKELELSLRGAVGEATESRQRLDLSVAWAELTYVDADGTQVALATDGTKDEPAHADALTRARRGVLEGLVGRPVQIALDPRSLADGGALLEVSGLALALDAAAETASAADLPPEVVDTAVGGLEPLLDDAAALRGLTLAGLSPASPDMRMPGREIRRAGVVHVDGFGAAMVELYGRCGEGRGDSPTVRLTGSIPEGAEWTGDPGPEAPEGVGPVRLADVTIAAQTEYAPRSLQPLRGSVSIELPRESGPLVTRLTEFVLVIPQ